MADNTIATPYWSVIKDDNDNRGTFSHVSEGAVEIAAAADGDRDVMSSVMHGVVSNLEGQRHLTDVVRHEGQEGIRETIQNRFQLAKAEAEIRREISEFKCELTDKVREEGRMTRELVKEMERRDLEKQLADSKQALLDLKISLLSSSGGLV